MCSWIICEVKTPFMFVAFFVIVFRVLDTKFMCNSSVFKQLIPSSVLAHVLEKIQQEPFSLPEVGE